MANSQHYFVLDCVELVQNADQGNRAYGAVKFEDCTILRCYGNSWIDAAFPESKITNDLSAGESARIIGVIGFNDANKVDINDCYQAFVLDRAVLVKYGSSQVRLSGSIRAMSPADQIEAGALRSS